MRPIPYLMQKQKCDEARPHCSRCRVLGVSCVYGSKLTAEALYSGTCFSVKSSPAPNPPRSPAAPLPVIPSSRPADVFQLAPVDVELIEKFQLRVVRTIGSERTGQHYADNVLPLAFSVRRTATSSISVNPH